MPRTAIKDYIRSTLVDHATSLIKEEGLSAFTVRKVAERAGLSYATLYNHFSNADHLLWHVTMSLIGESVAGLSTMLEPDAFTLRGVKDAYLGYIAYFAERPYAFDLIFLNRLGPPPEEFSAPGEPTTLASRLVERLSAGGGKPAVPAGKRKALSRTLASAIHGLLLFQLTGKSRLDAKGLAARVGEIVDSILGPYARP